MVISFYSEEDNQPVSVEIIDMVGKEVFKTSSTYSKGMHSIELPAENFAQGILFPSVTKNGKRVTKKVLVQKH